MMPALLTLLLLAGAVPAPVEKPTSPRLEDLGWLAGSWSGDILGAGASTRFETHYTTPQGGVILSTSKAFGKDGTLRWFEFERFEVKDGALQVVPHPNGVASVPFTLAEYDPAAKKAVFANPQHDYPNRITYHRVADDRLLIVVAGETLEAPVMRFMLSRQL
jgi:hypothetical protein